jgi:hypothetical protein
MMVFFKFIVVILVVHTLAFSLISSRQLDIKSK